MAAPVDILSLIADRRSRRAALVRPALDALFARLAASRHSEEAVRTEDRIWDAWMDHPHRAAAEVLRRATDDIAARRYDIAETRLSLLLRSAPGFAEAWHKRATLYYLLGRDDECLEDIRRTLALEPRHFAAMLHFVEILLGRGDSDDARFACFAALSVHPHLQRARELLATNSDAREQSLTSGFADLGGRKSGPPYNGRMNNDTYKVIVSRDLEDLIPVFMSNRHKEVQTLSTALAGADFEQLRQLGHRMKGVGNSYGFEQISLFGKRVEESALGRDKAAVEACIAEYQDYLSKLQVDYE